MEGDKTCPTLRNTRTRTALSAEKRSLRMDLSLRLVVLSVRLIETGATREFAMFLLVPKKSGLACHAVMSLRRPPKNTSLALRIAESYTEVLTEHDQKEAII